MFIVSFILKYLNLLDFFTFKDHLLEPNQICMGPHWKKCGQSISFINKNHLFVTFGSKMQKKEPWLNFLLNKFLIFFSIIANKHYKQILGQPDEACS